MGVPENSSFVKRKERLLFPTAMSPITSDFRIEAFFSGPLVSPRESEPEEPTEESLCFLKVEHIAEGEDEL